MDLKFELREDDSSSVISNENLVQEIQNIVQSHHTDKHKQELDMGSSDRIKIACVYCGDSEKYMSKKRGIIYLDTKTYKCWNCGIWKPLQFFFEDFGKGNVSVGMGEFKIETYAKTSRSTEMSIMDVFGLKDTLIPREELMKKMGLVEPVQKHQIYNNLLERKQNPDDRRFAVNPFNKDIVMFNMTVDERVLGIQIRKHETKANFPRFLSFPYGDIFTKILKQELSEKQELEASRVKRISLIYDILRVDVGRPIEVYESTMNANHGKNSIACWGAESLVRFDDAKYIFDDDVAGRKKAMMMLNEGHEVFLWSMFRKNNQKYKDANMFNDVNDIYKAGYTGENFYDYFSKSKLDMIWL